MDFFSIVVGIIGIIVAGAILLVAATIAIVVFVGAISGGICGAIVGATWGVIAALGGTESVDISAHITNGAILGGILGAIGGIYSFKESDYGIGQLIRGFRSNVSTHRYKDLPKLKDPAGYVYLIKEVDFSGQYKIGRTIDPKSRLKQVDLKTPGETMVIALLKTEDAKVLERRLHQKYASKRKRGEWFDLTDKQVQEIRNM